MKTPYAATLGSRLLALPWPCQALHRDFGVFRGTVTVVPARSALLRTLAKVLGMPPAGVDVPLEFETRPQGAGAQWIRRIQGCDMVSYMEATPEGAILETLGPATLHAALRIQPNGLSLEVVGVRVLGVGVPRMFWPRVSAREWAMDGRYHFKVELALPIWAGRLVAYEGALDVPMPPRGTP